MNSKYIPVDYKVIQIFKAPLVCYELPSLVD